jgi:hypothetical protein
LAKRSDLSRAVIDQAQSSATARTHCTVQQFAALGRAFTRLLKAKLVHSARRVPFVAKLLNDTQKSHSHAPKTSERRLHNLP